MLHTIKQAEGMTFKNYNDAINFLILLLDKDEELNSFVNTQIEVGDDIKIGNEVIPAIDVFDFI